MIMLFICMTLDGWTDIMGMLIKVMSSYVIIYFVCIIFIRAYLLVNLTIAVITINFFEAHNTNTENG